MEEEILELAMALGNTEESEREKLRLLCRAAEELWRRRLKAGVDAEDCAPAFTLAAAWTALAMEEEAGSVEQFSAGDLTIRSSGGERGKKLRAQAGQVMAPYTADDCFVFRGVDG